MTLRTRTGRATLGLATAAVAWAAAFAGWALTAPAASARPGPPEPSVEELLEAAQQLTSDFTAPTVRIRGKRSVRSPRVARLRVVARDNRRLAELEVFVDGKARHLTSKSRRKLVLRVRFRRRGRHKIVARALDGATTSSRLARATVVVR